jgi:hypothetical protein
MTWQERWHSVAGPAKSRMQEKWLGYPEEFHEPPLGAFLYAHGRIQVANGEAARMVLYQYDFEEGTDRLNHRGRQQLAKIAAMMPENFNPLVIEWSPDAPALDEARRVAVLTELGRGPFPVVPERVVVGPPVAYGLQGVEAELVYQNLLQQTQSRGTLLQPSTGFTSAGLIGGGFGTGAGAGGAGAGGSPGTTPR